MLSQEDLPSDVKKHKDDRQLSVEEKLLVEALETGLIITSNKILGLKSIKILRRNNLGFPRWRGNGSLPTSFEVRSSALRALGVEG